MMYGNSMMPDSFGQGYGHHAMWSGRFDGGFGPFDGFGPISLFAFGLFSLMLIVAFIWAIAIKGYALWHSAKRGEKWWFIALLIVNTFGLLELVYLIFFAKVWGKGKDKEVLHETHTHSEVHTHAHKHDQSHGEDHNHSS